MAIASGGSGEGTRHPVKIFANIFISFIGAGVLGLPYAFMEAGILEGILTMGFVGFVSVKAMVLLVDCKYHILSETKSPSPSSSSVDDDLQALIKNYKESGSVEEVNGSKEVGAKNRRSSRLVSSAKQEVHDTLSYGDLGERALGISGRYLVEIIIVVSQIGFCCAYLIFISENLSDYFQRIGKKVWIAMMLPLLAGLTFLRHLSSLAWSSLFAQISSLMAFTVVFWFDFEHMSKVSIDPKEFSLDGFPFFFCVSVYCYEGAGMILSLEASLANEMRPKFLSYFKAAMLVVTLLYISFGVAGYLSFGAETDSIITLNLPKGGSVDFAIFVKCCLCLALFFTYPVMMFPVLSILERRLCMPAESAVGGPSDQRRYLQGNILRCFLVVISGLVVLSIPNFTDLMALVGATCCTLLAFILPGWFHLRIFNTSLNKAQLFTDYFLIVLGIVAMLFGLWDAVGRLVESHMNSEQTDVDQVLNFMTLPPAVDNVTLH